MFYATLKIYDDFVRFKVLETSEDVNVSVEKRGNQKVLAGDIMRYDFANIRNDSNVSLDDFYFHDELPVDAVRLSKIVTGTWSERLTYSVEYRTNKTATEPWLLTFPAKPVTPWIAGGRSWALPPVSISPTFALTSAPSSRDFPKKTGPVFYVNTLAELASGYRIINRADAGGRTEDEWVIAKDT